MKRIVIIATLLTFFSGAKAQDCEAIMLPFFGGSMERLTQYRDNAPEKFEWRCTFSQAAFIESDSIPQGVPVYNISEVVSLSTGEPLQENFSVDLNTLSYYAYNFAAFQGNHSVEDRICFRTPHSAHPYLVLRSVHEMGVIADTVFENE